MPQSVRSSDRPDERRAPSVWRFLYMQRIIVIVFAIVEAALLGWAVAATTLRDTAR